MGLDPLCEAPMVASGNDPKLKLEFSGEAFADGRVPVTVVAAKLQALQTLLYHAAAAVRSHSGSRRGQWFNRYRVEAELSFAGSHHSNLVIEAELTPDPVLAEEFDVGKQAVDLVFDFGSSLATGQAPAGSLSKDDRRYLLRAFEGLMPNTTDQYQVVLENCNAHKHPRLTFTPQLRKQVRRLAAPGPADYLDEATLVGELIKIHVDTGEDKITVRAGPREIDCFYPDSFRDSIANLLAGSLVEVTGRATLDERGEIRKLSDVIDVDPVSMDPLRVSRFEHAGRRYALAAPLTLNVDYRDGIWVYFNDALNLWGYAERREDALSDLHESFDYVYREIAEADDSELDDMARRLKASLLSLVAPTAPGAP